MKPDQLAVMHWGTYRVTTDNGKLTAVSPVAWDRNPSRIGQSLPGAVQGTSRVRRPAVREGFLKGGRRHGKGVDVNLLSK